MGQTKKIYLIIFDDNESIYESGWWSNKLTLFDKNEATATMEMFSEYGETYYSVEFTDATYVLSITDYSEMDWYNGVNAVSAITFFVTILIVLLLYNHYIIKHIMQLSREVLLIDQGKMNQNISCKGSDEIALLASNVDNMRNSIISRFQSEKKAWETNSELITSMSHDIRTPLTSLIGYLDILESKDYQSEEQLEKYIKICKEKSVQLKDLSDKLFQYFFVFGKKDLAMLSETYDVTVLLQQLLGEHVVNLQINGYEVETKFTMKPCKITVDIHYLQRLFDNLFSNIMKYADPNEKVLITANVSGNDLFVYLSNNIRKDNYNMESTNIGLKTCERSICNPQG